MQDLKAAGKTAAYLPDADAIVGHLQAGSGRRRRGLRFQQRRLRRHPRKTPRRPGRAPMTGQVFRVNNDLRVCLRILFDGRQPTVARASRLRVLAASRRRF